VEPFAREAELGDNTNESSMPTLLGPLRSARFGRIPSLRRSASRSRPRPLAPAFERPMETNRRATRLAEGSLMSKLNVFIRCIPPLLLCTISACGGSDAPAGTTVTIAFEHLVDGAPVTIGPDTPYTNAAGNEFGVSLVRYFISDVTLHLEGGATITAPGAHYVDHDDPTTRTYELDVDVPAETLSSISFVMGLPPELNVTGAFPTEPELLMEWPEMMGGGYHFMKFEGRFINDASEPFNFRAHTGAFEGVDYSFDVVLDAGNRRLPEGEVTLTLEMNLEQWFTDPNDWDLNDYFTEAMPGIMGNAAAQASLQENGATVFSLGAP